MAESMQSVASPPPAVGRSERDAGRIHPTREATGAPGASADPYRLGELRGTFQRFVMVIVHFTGVRVVEVENGVIVQDLQAPRPEFEARVDRSWTRERFRGMQEALMGRFLREQAEAIDRRFTSGGHVLLILAGDPEFTGRLRSLLPDRLLTTLMEIVDPDMAW